MQYVETGQPKVLIPRRKTDGAAFKPVYSGPGRPFARYPEHMADPSHEPHQHVSVLLLPCTCAFEVSGWWRSLNPLPPFPSVLHPIASLVMSTLKLASETELVLCAPHILNYI